MATLFISEHTSIGVQSGGPIQVIQQPPVTEQTVSIGGSSTASSAFNAATSIVGLTTDAICSIKFGTGPTATASTKRMVAGQTEYFYVTPGTSMKVAVITNT